MSPVGLMLGYRLVLLRCSDGKLEKIFRTQKGEDLEAAKTRIRRAVVSYIDTTFPDYGDDDSILKGVLYFVNGNRKTRIPLWNRLCLYIDY